METVSPSLTRMSLKQVDKNTNNTSTDLFQEWRQQKRRESVPQVQRKDSSDSLVSKSSGKLAMRRRSTLKSITQSISGFLGLRRSTLVKAKEEQNGMENTYRMVPDQDTAFSASKVRQIAEEILETELADKSYDHSMCGKMACDLAIKIQTKVKDLNMPRYKIICQVVVGQVRDQGLEAASRCIWDPKTDSYECVSFKNNSIFAIALIHGLYYE